MNKSYYSLGLMSGTSGDGVDASLAISDGKNKFDIIHNEYVKYPIDVYEEFHKLKEKIHNLGDIQKYSKKLKDIERKITICNSTAVETIKFKMSQQKSLIKIDFIGFHGQTILHIPEKKFSLQLGDANLLSQITNTSVIYKFRENDLKNGGQGAPLAPIFHQLIVNQKKLNFH
ncbi:MAG: anhydro-N-acetylmuramic acid kinase [Candidatus Pelagibacter sp.]